MIAAFVYINNIITIEENNVCGGFGSYVAELLQQGEFCNANVKTLGIPDEFVEQGTQAVLRQRYGLDKEGIIRQAEIMLNIAPLGMEDKAGADVV